MARAKILFILSDPLIRVQKPHQMWKLHGTLSHLYLVNQKGDWHSSNKWDFIENGGFISIRDTGSQIEIHPLIT